MRSVVNDNTAAHLRHRGALNPNRSLDRLPIILGCFLRFLFIFRLLVDILPALLFRRGPLRLQEKDRQNAQQYTKSAQALTSDLG